MMAVPAHSLTLWQNLTPSQSQSQSQSPNLSQNRNRNRNQHQNPSSRNPPPLNSPSPPRGKATARPNPLSQDATYIAIFHEMVHEAIEKLKNRTIQRGNARR